MNDGNVEVHLVEMGIDHEEDGAALASLVLTLKLASSNLVRAAERLVEPGDDAAQAAIYVADCMDELGAAIELRLLSLDESLA